MKTNAFLVSLIAVLAVFLVSTVAAANLATIDSVQFNDIELVSGNVNIAGFAGETVPVRVTFTADADSEDVKVRVEMYGGRKDVSESTSRFNVVAGNVYTKLLSLELPSDLKDVTRDLTLKVRIYDANNSNTDSETEYVVKMQRESYQLDFLSVDHDLIVAAGDTVPVSVVIRNTGFQDSDDAFVTVTIPELGVSQKGYLGDLVSVEDCSNDCDDEDSVEKILFVRIPDSAKDGIYEVVVTTYDADAKTVARSTLKVEGSASTQVLATTKNQDMKAGETKTYDLILVNSGSKVKIFNLNAVSGSDLDVSVPSTVVVGPESSKTVEVAVKATDSAEVGTHTFTVDVNGEQVVMSANVTGRSTASNAVVALTVVLVIIFVVLLIVLIVLLLRRERPAEEEVETSYY